MCVLPLGSQGPGSRGSEDRMLVGCQAGQVTICGTHRHVRLWSRKRACWKLQRRGGQRTREMALSAGSHTEERLAGRYSFYGPRSPTGAACGARRPRRQRSFGTRGAIPAAILARAGAETRQQGVREGARGVREKAAEKQAGSETGRPAAPSWSARCRSRERRRGRDQRSEPRPKAAPRGSRAVSPPAPPPRPRYLRAGPVAALCGTGGAGRRGRRRPVAPRDVSSGTSRRGGAGDGPRGVAGAGGGGGTHVCAQRSRKGCEWGEDAGGAAV